ncbi:hypothetical protein Bca101_059811 [Brassica carinata]
MRCLIIFDVIFALLVCGPALYWKFNKGFIGSTRKSSVCPPCVCDCPPPVSLLDITPGIVATISFLSFSFLIGSDIVFWFKDWIFQSRFANLIVTDCGSDDPELKQEMEKHFVDLLTKEMKLVASQYQKEAEKCNAATKICESTRERAGALLIKERKITAFWEKRARQSGWEGE